MNAVKKAVVAAGWVLSLIIFVKSIGGLIGDPDLWMQMATGRAMVDGHTLLRTDIFTHTLSGTPFVNFERIGQIFLHLIYRAGGLHAVLAYKICFCLAALGLIVTAVRLLGGRGAWLLTLTWVAFMILLPRFNERLELFSFVFLAALIAGLLWMRRASAAPRWFPFVVFGLMAVWCNIHGGFIFGIGVLVLIDVGARWSRENPAYIRMLDGSVAAALAGTLINPAGVHLLPFMVWMARQVHGAPLIEEWLPSTVSAHPVFWVAWGICAGLVVVSLLRGARSAKFWTPVVVVFMVWSASLARNTSYLAFFFVPFFAELLPSFDKRRAARIFSWLFLLPLALFWRQYLDPWPRAALRPAFFPDAACRFVLQNDVRGTMYNSYVFGGYVEWALGPERKIFMDGRYICMPFLEEERAAFQISPQVAAERWRAYLDKYGVDYAISLYPPYIAKEGFAVLGPIDLMYPRDQWALLFWDDAAMVFVKRTPAFRPLIDRFEYRFLWPHNPLQMARMLKANKIKPADVEKELRRHLADVGPTEKGGSIQWVLDHPMPK